jgi:hypothetical protein
MMSSACDILSEESRRFVDYVLVNPKLRNNIVDKATFFDALEKALRSDPSLVNIADTIRKSGESFEVCGSGIYDQPAIQDLLKRNSRSKKADIRKKVKADHPTLKGRELTKEVDRRYKIFASTSQQKIKQVRQVSLDEALKPLKVGSYERQGKFVQNYRKQKAKSLTMQERMLIENAIKKGTPPSQVYRDYVQSGLGYRTQISIKRHYYRIKQKERL